MAPGILAAIDERLGSVDEEIKALEEQLDGKQAERSKLARLRAQAASIDDGAAPAAAPPKPKPTATPREPAGALAARADDIVGVVDRHPGGIRPVEVRTLLGLEKKHFDRARPHFRDRVRVEGNRGGVRYFPMEESSSAAPPAPTEDEPTPAEEESRTAAAAKHSDRRQLVKEAILDALKDGAVGADRLKAAVLKQVESADDGDFASARRSLAADRRIEVSANKLQLTGVQDNSKPLTSLEREVVEACGSGRTAREVAANCPQLKGNAFTATRVLTALAHRGVIRKRQTQLPGEQAIFERRLEDEAAQ